MAKIIFEFNTQKILIQCKITDSLKNICQSFANKINYDINKLIFLYGGKKLNVEKTFNQMANSLDIEKKEMNVLVYELNDNNDKIDEDKDKDNESQEFKNEVEKIKEKLNFILNKYLGDRKYVKDKIINWKDAIMKECESLFSIYYDEYIIFSNLMIYDISESKLKYQGLYNAYDYKTYFFVIFKTKYIKASILIVFYSKNKNRNKQEITEVLELIQTKFLNLAECREYDIFMEKYYQMFKNEFDELLSPYKKNLFFYYRISNNYYTFIADFKIFNLNKDNYFLSKIIKTDNCNLYIVLAKPQ